MVYCGTCAEKKGYPRSPLRSGGETPCAFCGEVDSVKTRNSRTGAEGVKIIGNYSYPDDLLPDSPNEVNNVRARERQGAPRPQAREMR